MVKFCSRSIYSIIQLCNPFLLDGTNPVILEVVPGSPAVPSTGARDCCRRRSHRRRRRCFTSIPLHPNFLHMNPQKGSSTPRSRLHPSYPNPDPSSSSSDTEEPSSRWPSITSIRPLSSVKSCSRRNRADISSSLFTQAQSSEPVISTSPHWFDDSDQPSQTPQTGHSCPAEDPQAAQVPPAGSTVPHCPHAVFVILGSPCLLSRVQGGRSLSIV
jgi:hypothetical protein